MGLCMCVGVCRKTAFSKWTWKVIREWNEWSKYFNMPFFDANDPSMVSPIYEFMLKHFQLSGESTARAQRLQRWAGRHGFIMLCVCVRYVSFFWSMFFLQDLTCFNVCSFPWSCLLSTGQARLLPGYAPWDRRVALLLPASISSNIFNLQTDKTSSKHKYVYIYINKFDVSSSISSTLLFRLVRLWQGTKSKSSWIEAWNPGLRAWPLDSSEARWNAANFKNF